MRVAPVNVFVMYSSNYCCCVLIGGLGYGYLPINRVWSGTKTMKSIPTHKSYCKDFKHDRERKIEEKIAITPPRNHGSCQHHLNTSYQRKIIYETKNLGVLLCKTRPEAVCHEFPIQAIYSSFVRLLMTGFGSQPDCFRWDGLISFSDVVT